MKHFITTISLQPSLRAMKYLNAEKVDFLANDEAFTNPVFIPIKNLAEKGEKIKVSVIITKDPDGLCAKNCAMFREELEMLRERIGFVHELDEIEINYAESSLKHINSFRDIIVSHIGNDEEIYADVTYGNKPTPMVLLMALNFCYQYKSEVIIEALTYGEVNHGSDKAEKPAFIFDVSALFFINSVMTRMAATPPADPLGFICTLIGGEDDNAAE